MLTKLRWIAPTVALLAVVAACGDDTASTDTTVETANQTTATTIADDSEADGQEVEDSEALDDGEAMVDGEAMNMGDPDATPAADVPDAELQAGAFELLGTRPDGFEETTGTATIARHDAGTTVTVEFSGLQPEIEYIAHLHQGTCAENGGAHYMFDAAGPPMPPNEIHLLFTSDGSGVGFMTAENDQVAGPEGQSVVVHPVELLDNKVACAQFNSAG